jgi:UDP-N-acetyl-D-mannosaminuronic acid dehydrogenase
MTTPPDLATLASRVAVDECDVTVIGGAGHVGIPLVLSLAEKGFRVNVNDTNGARLDMLRSGRLPFIEHGAEAVLKESLLQGRLTFTRSPEGIQKTLCPMNRRYERSAFHRRVPFFNARF